MERPAFDDIPVWVGWHTRPGVAQAHAVVRNSDEGDICARRRNGDGPLPARGVVIEPCRVEQAAHWPPIAAEVVIDFQCEFLNIQRRVIGSLDSASIVGIQQVVIVVQGAARLATTMTLEVEVHAGPEIVADVRRAAAGTAPLIRGQTPDAFRNPVAQTLGVVGEGQRNGSCAALLHYHIVDVPPVSIIALKVVVDKADLDALANIGPEIDSGAEPGRDASICRTFPAFLPVAPAGHALVGEGGAWQD